MPAISRSELERGPYGLSKDTTDWRMLSGHWTHQMMGGRGRAPVNHTPPALREEASQKQMYPGSRMMSSRQWDGHDVRMCRRMPKLLRAERGALFDSTGIQCQEVQRAASMDPSRPRLAGIPMQACCSLPCSRSRSFRGTFVCWRIACSSARICSYFSVGSSMHHQTPLNAQPSSSFRVSHRPSPWSSFFTATGSSLVPPVTDGGGKTEWMAWSRVHKRCSSWALSVV